MSCYVLGDEMRGKDRTEEKEGHERRDQKTNTDTLRITPFPEHLQTVTKVAAVRKVKISILVATSHSSGDGEWGKIKG